MMLNKTKLFFVLALVALSGSFGGVAYAADLYISPETSKLQIGQEFALRVKLNSDGTPVNAAQAIVHFPVSLLEVVDTNRAGSIFSFWVEEPTVSNSDGTVSFIGGSSKGVAGSALQVLTINFRVRGSGLGDITISDAIATASDGRGTNVLSKVGGASFAVGIESVAPPKVSVTPPEEPVVVITRKAEPSKNLPVNPVLRIPLYPSEDSWYSHLGETAVFWEVPNDVVRVAATIDQKPRSEPVPAENDLVNGKKFGELDEGVWYAHVQFRNNVGWGPVTHYKIQIDDTPPLPFDVSVAELISDNPTPSLNFATQDELSGVDRSVIYVDGEVVLETADRRAILDPLAPGKHTLLVRVFDRAGNSVEDGQEIEILPLPTPTITFASSQLLEGEMIFAAGMGLVDGYTDVKVVDKNGVQVFVGSVENATDGRWEISGREPLARGTYVLTATARDRRGATSFPTGEETIQIKAQPLITLAGVDLGIVDLLLILLVMIFAAIAYFARFYLSEEDKRVAYEKIFAEDVKKLSSLLMDQINRLKNILNNKDNMKRLDPNVQTELEYGVGKLSEIVDYMRKYLRK